MYRLSDSQYKGGKMIIHKLVKTDNGLRYLCNQAVSITDIKGRMYWNKVTCKNCLIHKPHKTGGKDGHKEIS